MVLDLNKPMLADVDLPRFTPRAKRARANWPDLSANTGPSRAETVQQAFAAMQQAQAAQDSNRPETAEAPWRGALDPFGDV